DKRVLTVTRKTASGPKTITLDVSDGAKIESEGKTVTLGDLEPGQAATITYNTDLEIITGISADKLAPGAGFEPLFDGKTLDGWAGDKRYWKVEDGVIVGKNPDNSGEQFLRTAKTFDNFVLRLKFRHITGNSGVNFRSHTVPGGFLAGPQAEIADLRLPKLHIAYGVLYDNRGQRGVIADVDTKLKARLIASVRKTDWSE